MTSGNLEMFDLVVIGAGINGAGIARDAALRGLQALLLDKGDIASGTTSWSTRLIHGGLRYLEHGEVGLVRESLRERERLLRIAPHLVRPLPLLIPMYEGDRRGPLLIRAGMVAYDLLSIDKSLPRHQMLDRAAAMQQIPGLADTGLRGAALYYDAQVEYAERLALENAIDARQHGAQVRTYHRVDQIVVSDGQVSGVEGTNALNGESFSAVAPVIVNVAGPWVDDVLAGTRDAVPGRLIGGTKGSHIVVQPFPGAPQDAVYAEARRDRRPLFVIPWNGEYLIGTTDTRYTGSLDWVVAEDDEIAWLLEETNRLFPAAGLTAGDICYTYAGVRPLPYAPHSAESNVTRGHTVFDHGKHGGPRGLYSVVGGKLTTYRELAEQTIDLVLEATERPRTRSQTAELPLPGGKVSGSWSAFVEAFMRDAGLPQRSATHLLRVYGARAPEVLATATSPDLLAVIDEESGAIAAEVPWAFREEETQTLADVVARRSMIGLGSGVGIGADKAAAAVAQRELGWTVERAEAEVRAYREWLVRYRPRALRSASPKDEARAS